MNAKAVTVLIVDDDQAICRAYTQLLEREGFAVSAVHSGLAGLAAVQQQRYDVVLCDLEMAFLKGLGFYEEVRNEFPEQAKRVVFVTGFTPDDQTRKVLERSGRPMLHKPVEFTELIAAVRSTAAVPAP